jgi:two-component system cell cycle sensor histidine kinase/response regulator CckA
VAFKASGVVHDLNNALTCILQNAELAREGVEAGFPVVAELDDIVRAAVGATSMSRTLLRSSLSPDNVSVARVRMPEVVVEELRCHGVTLGEDISLDCDIADFDGWVPLSPGAAHQVLMNLVVNARQAMPSGGHLQVAVGPAVGPTGAPELELCVADTGMGIPQEIVQRIFEPMFTTKRGTGGTGLGLATVHSIVVEAGGRVEVRSAEGEGTTFIVRLPLVNADGLPESRLPGFPVRPTRGATILLVDDDARVRSSVERSLLRYGYNVLAASGADEALALSRAHGDELDLLLTDFRMPLMDGIELGRQVRATGIDVPMLLVTGCAGTVRFSGQEDQVDRLLEKPFTPRQLVSQIEASLAPRGAPDREPNPRRSG